MSSLAVRGASMAFGGLLISTSALYAADLPTQQPPASSPVFATQWNPWMVRVRALVAIPQSTDRVLAGGSRVDGGKVDVTTTAVPEIDVSYFFTPNISAELIAGVTWHDAKGAGSLTGLGKLGHTYLLPPTLTLQYHFTQFGNFRPYVGAGVTYAIFFAENDKALDRFRVSDAVGPALQIGADYMLNEHWGVNLDLKKLFLNPVARGNLGGTPVRARLDLDPWLVGAGITYKF